MKILESLLDAVFPPICAGCGQVGREPFCVICEGALEPAPAFVIDGADEAAALWIHGGPAALAVQHLKFHDHPELARPLGIALASRASNWTIDVAVPVPISRGRLVERGYNQSRELIRGLSIPVASRALARRSEVPPQVGLDRMKRLENVAGAIGAGPDAGMIRGKRVLLVDDVVTTGATAEASSRALRSLGAQSILVLALTRAE
jgi:ComF family protein